MATIDLILGNTQQPTTPPGIDSSIEGASMAQRNQAAQNVLGGQVTSPAPAAPSPTPSSPATAVAPAPAQSRALPPGASGEVLKKNTNIVPTAADKINSIDITSNDLLGKDTERPLTMMELLERMGPSEEEKEKERKKKKREQIFAAISDGISALSNLFFTSRYAPNMYDPRNSALSRVNNKWAQLEKERQGELRDKFDLILRAKGYDNNLDYQNYQKERNARNDERDARNDQIRIAMALAKEERDQEKSKLDKDLMKGKISEQQHKVKIAEAEAKYAEAQQKAELARKNRANRNSGGSGGSRGTASARKAKELENAYNYWMSLSEKDKNTYRNQNKRGKRVKVGEEGRGGLKKPVYGIQYMDDDDDFILQVWEQRKAYLRTHGREDEIDDGGYNLDYRQSHSKDLSRNGRKKPAVKKSAI